MLGNEVIGYQVIVNRLEHRTGRREVVQSSVYDDFVEIKEASVSGLGICDDKGTCLIILDTFLQLLRSPTISQ